MKSSKKNLNLPWESLANELNSETGQRLLNLLRQQEVIGEEKPSTSFSSDSTFNEPQAIGPWKPIVQGETIVFQRTDPWDKYLWLEEKDVLHAKKPENVFRICLVGESVAAGMFFAPYQTPAKTILHQLVENIDDHLVEFEMIDLSRNAMRAELLVEIVDCSTQLFPDLIIVYAGNNFCRNHTIGRPDNIKPNRDHLSSFKQQGIKGLFNQFRQDLKSATEQIVNSIHRSAQKSNSKVLWIIPDTSLSWKRFAPIHRLDMQDLNAWNRHFKRAIDYLERNSPEEALEEAELMKALDLGLNPSTHRIFIEAFSMLNQYEKIQFHKDLEVDCDYAIQRRSFLSPGIHSYVKKTIQSEADKFGIFTVIQGDVLTDDSSYIDYCHLSIHGINKLTISVVQEIIGTFNFPTKKNEDSPNKQYKISNHREARGLFDALIYKSHMQIHLSSTFSANLQLAFEQLIDFDPSISDVMIDYLKMHTPGCVPQASPFEHNLLVNSNSKLDFGILQWIRNINIHIIQSICDSLDRKGFNGQKLLLHFHDYELLQIKSGIELTNPKYLKDFAKDGTVDWDEERGTYRTQPYIKSNWPWISFVFVAQESLNAELTFSGRILASDSNQLTRIILNDTLIQEIKLNNTWSKYHIQLPGTAIKNGFNILKIEWPELSTPSLEEETWKNNFLINGKIDFYPIYGEIFTCHIQQGTNEKNE